jgi:PAS domain S-box-containing protein
LAPRTGDMSWTELQREVAELRAREGHREDLRNTIRQLEIYQEEVARQNRELIETQGLLERSNARYAALFDLAPVGYVMLDERGVIEEANRLATEIFGLPHDRLVGTPLVAFAGWDQAFEHLEAARNAGGSVRTRLRIRRHDGETRPVEFCSRRAEHGDGIRIIVTDLTAIEVAEAERRELEVQARVAREANDAKDRFIAMLSHELQTPLMPVVASLEVLEGEEGLSETARAEIARVRRNVFAEARLIGDLLEVVRINRGSIQVERERVDLASLIPSVLEPFGTDARRVRLSVRDAPEPVFADPMRLRQILANLVRNALAATRDGGDVELSAQVSDGVLCAEVKDSGEGIEPARLEQLFAAFERGESPGSGTGGLGLGLVVCRALAKAHGGTLGAVSDGRGKGSRFTVRIPCRPPDGEQQPLAASGVPHPPPHKARRADGKRPLRILLVDDHIDTVESLGMLLERRGYEVRRACSIEQAIEAAEESLDAVISDIALGGETGHELLARLRARGCTAPAIALSGFGALADAARSQQAGFAAHLAKPVRIDRLVEALKRATAA